jgi:hypothetical protein
MALYSAYVLDGDLLMGCFLVVHGTISDAKNTTKPWFDYLFIYFLSPAHLSSLHQTKHSQEQREIFGFFMP